MVMFSEDNATTPAYITAAPWIAFISCDANATNVSTEDDVFTLAQARGATAVVG